MRDESEAGASRRRYLATLAGGGLVGLARCDGGTDQDGRTSPGTDGTQPSPTPTPVPDDWAEGGPPERDGWEVTFADRFEGAGLDRSVWENGFGDRPLQCPQFDGRDFCAVEEQSFLRDGRLVLEATEGEPPVPEDEQWQDNLPPHYATGVVNTEDAFQQTFGYFECKARIEAEPGTNPAFWLFDIDDDYHREINVEFRGDERGRLVDFGVVHEDGEGEPTFHSNDTYLQTPTHETFHVFGVEWRPDEIGLDVDGERVITVEDFTPVTSLRGEDLYVVFDFAVFDGAEWIGDPADAEFPLEFEVEWVRAWQHEEYR